MAQPGKDGNFDIFSKLVGSGLKKTREKNEDEFKKKYEASQTQIETLKALVQQLLEENKSIKEEKETLQENFTNLCDAAKDQLEKKDQEIESLKKLLKEYEDASKYTPLQEQDSGLYIYSSEESEKCHQKEKGNPQISHSQEINKAQDTDTSRKTTVETPIIEKITSSAKDAKHKIKSVEDSKQTEIVNEDISLLSKSIVTRKEHERVEVSNEDELQKNLEASKKVEKCYEDKRYKSTEASSEVKQAKKIIGNVEDRFHENIGASKEVKESKQEDKSHESKRYRSTEASIEVKQTKKIIGNLGQKSTDVAKEDKHGDKNNVDTKKQREGQRGSSNKPVDEKTDEKNKRNEDVLKKSLESSNSKKRKEMDTTSKDNDNKKQKLQTHGEKVMPSPNLKNFRIPKVKKSTDEKGSIESKTGEEKKQIEKTNTPSPAESLKRFRIPKRKKSVEEKTDKTEMIDKEKTTQVCSTSSDYNQGTMIRKLSTQLQTVDRKQQKEAVQVMETGEGNKKFMKNKTSLDNEVNAERDITNYERKDSHPQAIAVPRESTSQSDKENSTKGLDDLSKLLPSLFATHQSSKDLTIQTENITEICKLSEIAQGTVTGKAPDLGVQVNESQKNEKDGLKERNNVEQEPPAVSQLLQHVRSESYDKKDNTTRPRDDTRNYEKIDEQRYRKKSRNYDTKPVSDGDRVSSYLGVARRRDRVEKEMLKGKHKKQQKRTKEERGEDVDKGIDMTGVNVKTDAKGKDPHRDRVEKDMSRGGYKNEQKSTQGERVKDVNKSNDMSAGNVRTDVKEKDTQKVVGSSTLYDKRKERLLKSDKKSSDENQSSLEDINLSNEKVETKISKCNEEEEKNQRDDIEKSKRVDVFIESENAKEKVPQDEEYMLAFGYGEDAVDEGDKNEVQDESAEIDYDDIMEFDNSETNVVEGEDKTSEVPKTDSLNRFESEDDMSKDGLMITDEVLAKPDSEQKNSEESDGEGEVSSFDDKFQCNKNNNNSNLKTDDTQNESESETESKDSDTVNNKAEPSDKSPSQTPKCPTSLTVTPLPELITPITSVKASTDKEPTTKSVDNEESVDYPGIQLFAPDADSLLTEDNQGEYASPVKMKPREGLSKVNSPSKFEVAKFLRRSPRKRKNTTQVKSSMKKLQLESNSKETVLDTESVTVSEGNVELCDKVKLDSTIEEGEITSESEEDIPKVTHQEGDKRNDVDQRKRGPHRPRSSKDEEKKKNSSVSRSGRDGSRGGRSDSRNTRNKKESSASLNRRDRNNKQTSHSSTRDPSEHRNKQARTGTGRDRGHTQKLSQRSSHEKDQSAESTTGSRSRTSGKSSRHDGYGENVTESSAKGEGSRDLHRQEHGIKRGENRRHVRSRISDNRSTR